MGFRCGEVQIGIIIRWEEINRQPQNCARSFHFLFLLMSGMTGSVKSLLGGKNYRPTGEHYVTVRAVAGRDLVAADANGTVASKPVEYHCSCCLFFVFRF